MLSRVMKCIWPLAIVIFLSACSGVSVKQDTAADPQAYQQRADRLTELQDWGFSGKISLDDGDQGGSGKLLWNVSGEQTELDFHAALGRGAWHLVVGPAHAVLTEANGQSSAARTVDGLIQQRMGWPIPVEALQWWVRGLSAPGEIDERIIDADGRLLQLQQFGWTVDFSRYGDFSGIAMPKRLNAIQDDYRVKLAVSGWRFSDESAEQN